MHTIPSPSSPHLIVQMILSLMGSPIHGESKHKGLVQLKQHTGTEKNNNKSTS